MPYPLYLIFTCKSESSGPIPDNLVTVLDSLMSYCTLLGTFLFLWVSGSLWNQGDALEHSLLSKATSPRCSHAGIYLEAFVFVIKEKTVGFVHSLWRGMEAATGISGIFPAEGCKFSSVTLSDFHVPFSISQIPALYGWMFGGLISVVLPSHLSFLLVRKDELDRLSGSVWMCDRLR